MIGNKKEEHWCFEEQQISDGGFYPYNFLTSANLLIINKLNIR